MLRRAEAESGRAGKGFSDDFGGWLQLSKGAVLLRVQVDASSQSPEGTRLASRERVWSTAARPARSTKSAGVNADPRPRPLIRLNTCASTVCVSTLCLVVRKNDTFF